MIATAFTLNGVRLEAEVEPRTSLADFLRGTQQLTATHLGCEHGACGACTLLIDGEPSRSCIVFTASLQGADVRTLEGLQDDPLMARVQDAFHAEHALQCGFCTPGMLVTARDIASRFETIDAARIRTELSGNLCRCTGYMGVVNAVQRVIREVPVELRLRRAGSAPGAANAMAAQAVATVAAPSSRNVEAHTVAARTSSESSPAASSPVAVSQKSTSQVEDAFIVDRSREEVWQLFADTARMASCLPGFELEREEAGAIHGRMHAGFGPIKASFACVATHERDDAAHTGVIRGSGQDARGGSRARGTAGYRVLPDPANAGRTRVEVTLEYQVQGPLAQFSRSALMRSFASKLVADFARNLSAALAGEKAPPAVRAVGLAGMVWSLLRERMRRLLRRA